jgi:hypothetical protein
MRAAALCTLLGERRVHHLERGAFRGH